jgi:hypothetical protein
LPLAGIVDALDCLAHEHCGEADAWRNCGQGWIGLNEGERAAFVERRTKAWRPDLRIV